MHPIRLTAKIWTLASIITATFALSACGSKIDTGRNADPTLWPKSSEETDTTETKPPGSQPGLNGTNCFDAATTEIPETITKLCQEHLKPEPAFEKLYPIICEQGKVIAAFDHPECGWDGNPTSIRRHYHHYYEQKDKTLDYEDIHASFVTVPAPSAKFMGAVRLVFENYDEFKRQGFQWVAGTREHRNLSGTKWEEGIRYRFRADKEAFEIGYQGFNKLYQLGPNLWVHLNHATGDFARITHFSQVVFYRQHPDQTSSSFKLEHRKIRSQGYYDIARKSGSELITDVMQKGYRNATK